MACPELCISGPSSLQLAISNRWREEQTDDSMNDSSKHVRTIRSILLKKYRFAVDWSDWMRHVPREHGHVTDGLDIISADILPRVQTITRSKKSHDDADDLLARLREVTRPKSSYQRHFATNVPLSKNVVNSVLTYVPTDELSCYKILTLEALRKIDSWRHSASEDHKLKVMQTLRCLCGVLCGGAKYVTSRYKEDYTWNVEHVRTAGGGTQTQEANGHSLVPYGSVTATARPIITARQAVLEDKWAKERKARMDHCERMKEGRERTGDLSDSHCTEKNRHPPRPTRTLSLSTRASSSCGSSSSFGAPTSRAEPRRTLPRPASACGRMQRPKTSDTHSTLTPPRLSRPRTAHPSSRTKSSLHVEGATLHHRRPSHQTRLAIADTPTYPPQEKPRALRPSRSSARCLSSAGRGVSARPQSAGRDATARPQSAGRDVTARPQSAGRDVTARPQSAGRDVTACAHQMTDHGTLLQHALRTPAALRAAFRPPGPNSRPMTAPAGKIPSVTCGKVANYKPLAEFLIRTRTLHATPQLGDRRRLPAAAPTPPAGSPPPSRRGRSVCGGADVSFGTADELLHVVGKSAVGGRDAKWTSLEKQSLADRRRDGMKSQIVLGVHNSGHCPPSTYQTNYPHRVPLQRERKLPIRTGEVSLSGPCPSPDFGLLQRYESFRARGR